MGEREPAKEVIQCGELFYFWHPGSEDTFSGYGIALEANRKDRLTGILMVDRSRSADPSWLQDVQDTFGECQLVPMTATGERGLVCQLEIEEDSLTHLCRFPSEMSGAIQIALEPLLEEPPAPKLRLRWDEESRLWQSEFVRRDEAVFGSDNVIWPAEY